MNAGACVDPAVAEVILARYPAEEASLIQVLQDVQRVFRFLPCEVLELVAARLGVPLSRVFSVATFYKAFALEPQGRTVIRVCTGTACHIRGASLLLDELARTLHVRPGETTTDGRFTLETVNCVGACAMAPVLIAGGQYVGEARPARLASYLAAGEAGDAH
jgi:NADH:ubiquinone oxidoreductase subunit E